MKFDNLAPIPKDKLYLIALAAPRAEIVRVPAESLIKREGRVLELKPWPKRPSLTDSQRVEIATRYALGEDPVDLAREFGVSDGYASAEASRQGLRRQRRPWRRRPKSNHPWRGKP